MPTKILIVIPAFSSYLSGLLRATRYLGIETRVFDSRGHTLLEKIIIGVTRKNQLSVKLLNRRLIGVAKDFKPDILLAMKGELISGETLKQINNFGIKTVNWFPDYINAFKLALKLSEFYNYFFHFDPLAISQLKKEGVKNIYYLPFAADILPDDSKLSKDKKRYKISFIGNYDRYREKYLKSISNLGLNIWGNKKWVNSSLAHCYQGYLPNLKFSEISNSSKININIQHEYPGEGLVLRTFEVLGAGAFLLTEKNKDIKRLFKNKLATFITPEDLRKKVSYFLVHDKEREKLANKGYSEVKARHSYIHRIRKILKTCDIV